MRCENRVSHTIQSGDDLYKLAQYYRTNVPAILRLNPNINPYNLQIGSSVTICPGESFTWPQKPAQPPRPDMSGQLALSNDMRTAWSQHVYWTRMLLISIAERLKDQQAVTDRLLQNPADIANIFAGYYPANVTRTITRLLTEHLQIGAALITALRDGSTAEAEKLERQWYQNANQMADAFSSINPYYEREEVRKMLYEHLELTTQEVSHRLAGEYQADIRAFDSVEREALMMADYFSQGIMRQFPQQFN